MVFLICRKLDYNTHRAFELEQASKENYATMKELQTFIDKRALALENLEVPSARTSKDTQNQGMSVTFISSSSTDTKQSTTNLARPEGRRKYECSACGALDCRGLSSCTAFCNKSVQDRRRFVETGQRCFNCLSYGHAAQTCFSTRSCRRCGQRHYTLLHLDEHNAASSPSELTDNSSGLAASLKDHNPDRNEAISPVTHHHNFIEFQILLATALVRVETANGWSHTARCMLDSQTK